ncbi:MAG: adenosylmethionine--8-amino-7-oxononanoate transaminase [Acidimicrobiales bacterium]
MKADAFVPHRDPVTDLVGRDRAVLWHPYAPAAQHPSEAPLAVVSASGVRLRLADGRELIDAMSSWWAAIHGYRHSVLDAAARAQLDDMSHVMFGGLTHRSAVELAERLVAITPDALERVFLSDSGSVAVEVAIKMAVQYQRGRGRPGRRRMLTVRGGYHGDTIGAMSVCDPVTGMHSMFNGMLAPQIFAPVPMPVYGDTFTVEHVAELGGLLAEHRDEIAAVVLEPVVQGAGGMRFYSPGYLAAVRELCDEAEVLLIADEIATGFGRSGELFGCDHAGVTPDIMCLGKAMTGGYLSMAATLCTAEVADGVSAAESGALMHGPTFMANPLAAAVSVASIDLLVGADWRATVKRIEDALVTGLSAAKGRPGVADVRVLGAIGVIEMAEPVPVAARDVFVERGVWLRPFGRLLYTMPPYVTDDADVVTICDAMLAVVDRFG